MKEQKRVKTDQKKDISLVMERINRFLVILSFSYYLFRLMK